MTATPLAAGRKSREVTVSYLGELLQNAGFVDEKQKIEIDNLDRQLRAQSRSARARGEDRAGAAAHARRALHPPVAAAAQVHVAEALDVEVQLVPHLHPVRREA